MEIGMSNSQKVTVFNFIKWLTTHYIQLEKKTIPYPFRLGCFPNTNNYFSIKNEKLLTRVEFSGQKDIFEVEIVAIINQNLFEYFSPEDKKKIFSIYYNKERFKLTGNYYCQEKRMEMVVLKDISTGNIKYIPSHLVSENDAIINQLSPKDIRRISFLSAMDHFKSIFRATKE